MALERSLYAKYGGVHFTQKVPTQDINDFVRALPSDKRDSLFEVLAELNTAGLIEIENNHDIVDAHGESHPLPPSAESKLH